MTLDVELPDPPTLSAPENTGDYDAVDEAEDRTGDDGRRDALAEFLREGAWEDGFEEWAGSTYLDEEQFRAVLDLELIEEFDFYWNEPAEDVGYRAPTVPDDQSALDGERLDRNDRQDVDEALDELGRTVSEVLENDYVHRSSEEFGYSWE